MIFIEALLPVALSWPLGGAAVPDDCGVIVGVEVLEFDGQRRG